MLSKLNINLEKKLRAQQIINSSRYNPKKQSLDLSNISQDWSNVILVKDWTKIRDLSLMNCQIGDHNLAYLCEKQWPFLKKLWLWNNSFSANGLSQVIFRLSFNQLTQLLINNNPLCCAGAKLLAKTDFPLLQQLWINDCLMNNEGIRHLSKGNWINLASIRLGNNFVGLDGILELNWYRFPKLKQVLLDWSLNVDIGCMSLVTFQSKYISICKSFQNQEMGELVQLYINRENAQQKNKIVSQYQNQIVNTPKIDQNFIIK